MNNRQAVVSATLVLAAVAIVLQPVQAAPFTLTGTVINEASVGQPNVDLDAIDLCTGSSVVLVNDKTAVNGAYSIILNPGTYDIRFTPPAGSTLAAGEIKNLVVAANLNLGATTLHPGWLLSGIVQDSGAVGIPSVKQRFIDTATGERIYVTKTGTSATGTYSARVRSGTYDIEYRPAAGDPYITKRRSNVVVAGNVSGLVDTLPGGLEVSGLVQNALGSALENVDLDFFDLCTGDKVPTANDNTDATGAYDVFVPPGEYSIWFNPPECRQLGAERLAGQTISTTTVLPTMTLLASVVVSGTVLGDVGQPVANLQLKFYHPATDERQAVQNDTTDAAGHFAAKVRGGTYNINFEPPKGVDLLPGRLENVNATLTTFLGTLALGAGEPVNGLVLGPGAVPVENVDIDAVNAATLETVRLANDVTIKDGTFRIVMAPGTYNIRYAPPVCTELAPSEQKNVVVGGPTSLPTQQLALGVHVSGLVTTNLGAAVPDADLDFFDPGSGLQVFTAHDNTDAAGLYDVIVSTGTYDILYKPPVGSGLAPRYRHGVVVAGDLTLPVTQLLPLTVPGVTSVAPISGSTAGGQAVVVTGSGFQPDAKIKLGGVSASGVSFVSTTQLNAVTSARPAGLVAAQVVNPGDQVGGKPNAYTYVEPAVPIVLKLSKVGSNVSLTWTATGQAKYTVFRDASPTGFTDGSILAVTTATAYVDVNGATGSGIRFYQVD